MASSVLTADGLAHRLEPLTQTLFSAHLIADILPRLWALDPAEGEVRLAELRELTLQALSCTNVLLDELHAQHADQETCQLPG